MSTSSIASNLEDPRVPEGVRRVLAGLFAGEDRVHAVLLYGNEGSPTELVAQILVKYWLCTKPTAQGACGECPSCQAYERGNASDYYAIKPQPPSHVIRLLWITRTKFKRPDDPPISLHEFFQTMPLRARHKVGSIEEASALNGDAANALLKTLEEPHPHAKLVLTTHALSRVLPTVLSRCLAIPCELVLPELHGVPKEFAEAAPHFISRYQANPELYGELFKLGRHLGHAKPREMLKLGEQFREICSAMEKAESLAPRYANGQALSLLSALVLQHFPTRPELAQAAISAHRKIMGNCQLGITLDALFAELVS